MLLATILTRRQIIVISDTLLDFCNAIKQLVHKINTITELYVKIIKKLAEIHACQEKEQKEAQIQKQPV